MPMGLQHASGLMDDFSSEPGPNDGGPLIATSEMFMKQARGEYGQGPPQPIDGEDPSSTGQERFGMGVGVGLGRLRGEVMMKSLPLMVLVIGLIRLLLPLLNKDYLPLSDLARMLLDYHNTKL